MKPFLILFALLGGCATVGAAEGPVAIGQRAYAGGPQVTPIRVIEDSRCPMNARCIWAGRAIVRARVSGGSSSKVIDLTLGEPVPVADGQLTLVSVTPDREASKPLKPRDYRFTFDFQGGL